MERDACNLRQTCQVEHRERRLELVQHVGPLQRLVQDDAGRPLPHFDGRPHARPAGVQHDHVVRAHARDEAASAVRAPRDPARIPEGQVADGLLDGTLAVVQVRVEVGDRGRGPRRSRRQQDPQEDAIEVRLEAHLVDAVGPHHGDGLGHGVHAQRHVDVHQAVDGRDGEALGVDDHHVLVDHRPALGSSRERRVRPADQVGPVAAVVVHPAVLGITLHDQPDRGWLGVPGSLRGSEVRARVRRRVDSSVRAERIGDHVRDLLLRAEAVEPPAQHGGAIAGLEDGRVDRGSVRADGQRSRLLDAEVDLGQRRARSIRVEHLEQVGLGAGDEGPLRGTGKDHVRRLVAGADGPHHAAGGEVDDADAVRDRVDHPGLVAGAEAHADRVDPDRDVPERNGGSRGDVEDLQPRVGRVADEQALPSLVKGERGHVRRLPVDEVLLRRGCRDGGRGEGEQQGEAIHESSVCNARTPWTFRRTSRIRRSS